MGVTAVTLTGAKKNPSGKTLFHGTAYSADWQSGENAIAAPAAGALYIERMLVVVVGAITFVLGDGTTDWTFVGSAEGVAYPLVFKNPVRLTATTALIGTGSGAGGCVVDAEGFIA